MEARVDPRTSETGVLWSDVRDQLQTVWARVCALHGEAVAVLETQRVQLERSRALVERSRALCRPLRAVPPAPEPDPAPDPLRCALSGCARPARFQPCFVLAFADRRVVVRDLPVPVCAEHRGEVDALFGRAPVIAALRRKLARLGRNAPDEVRVLFEVLEDGESPPRHTSARAD